MAGNITSPTLQVASLSLRGMLHILYTIAQMVKGVHFFSTLFPRLIVGRVPILSHVSHSFLNTEGLKIPS